ncbi:MAG: radical SAM protein, partial [Bacteroidaceae bacterium]|nr:radical SAM protein [Bacteroidaceae bacterium]
MKSRTIDIITLGCSKNLVDSEKLIRQLELNGFKVTHDAEEPEGEIAIVNTCGFIGDAKEESINMILELARRKEQGKLKQLIVMGCLSQRYFEELKQELPEVDRFYGKFDWEQIITDLNGTYHREASNERHLTTPSHYAYLKISEGCNRHCAYCAIPIITGKQKSHSIEEIVAEVESLVAKGVKEFQVIAQELTGYGTDLYGKQMIAPLIDRIAEVPGVEWIRLHYGYPA